MGGSAPAPGMLQAQVYAFLMLALAGAVAGALFDVLRVIRRWAQPGKTMETAADLLYWVPVTAVLAAALFLGNWGEFRLYVALALAAGAGLYFWLASPVVLVLLRLLLGTLLWLLAAVFGVAERVLLRPAVAVGTGLARGAGWAARWAARPARRLGRWGAQRWLALQQGFITRLLSWLVPPRDDDGPPDGEP